MLSSGHAFADVREEFEVHLFPGSQRISTEVRNDPIDEKRKAPNLPLQCPIASVGSQGPASEVPLDLQQNLIAVSVLADRNARSHLPPDQQRWSRCDRHSKASLTVDVSRDVRRQIHESFTRARVSRRPWICHGQAYRQ